MSLVGASNYPHALRPGDAVIWRQRDGVCTVLVVKDVKRITVEHALPFYRASYAAGRDADFTHVMVTFKGLPWPSIFGPGQNVEQYHAPVSWDD